MEFALSPVQTTWQQRARAFASIIAPDYGKREQDGAIASELIREMGALGLIAPELPVDIGGQGLDHLTSGLITEQIARGDFNVSYVQVVGSLVGQIIASNATPRLASAWIPRICRGESIVGIGLSEPQAGSDAGMPRLRAERRNGGWVLNGSKSMSFSQAADAVVVFAKTDPSARRSRGISAFLVPLGLAGVARQRFEDMGTVAVGRGLVHFTAAWIPDDHLLGKEGSGFTQVMHGFDFSRALIGLQCLAVAALTVEETWQYVSHRKAFDQPLSKFQGVSFPLAEAETLLAAAQLLCYQTLWLKDQDLPHTAQAAMCKWWAPKVAFDIVKECLLLHGQFGYKKDLPIEQRLRDVLGLQIGDGTAQIMKLIIARQAIGRQLAP